MDDDLLRQHVDAIHAVARADFVAERTSRSRSLRAEGHAEEAKTLAGWRKPTVAAWAVNQLARRHADEIADLLDAGTALRSAQLRASSGAGAEALRPATRRVRDLTAALAGHAEAILVADGVAAHHGTEVEQTLFAVAIDPDLHEVLRRGVLHRAIEAAGFGAMAPLSSVVATAPELPPAAEPPPDPGDADPDGGDTARADTAAQRDIRVARRRSLDEDRVRLARAVLRQQRQVERRREQAAALQARLEELHSRAAEADADTRAAQDRLDTLTTELASVDSQLQDLDVP